MAAQAGGSSTTPSRRSGMKGRAGMVTFFAKITMPFGPGNARRPALFGRMVAPNWWTGACTLFVPTVTPWPSALTAIDERSAPVSTSGLPARPDRFASICPRPFSEGRNRPRLSLLPAGARNRIARQGVPHGSMPSLKHSRIRVRSAAPIAAYRGVLLVAAASSAFSLRCRPASSMLILKVPMARSFHEVVVCRCRCQRLRTGPDNALR